MHCTVVELHSRYCHCAVLPVHRWSNTAMVLVFLFVYNGAVQARPD